MTIDPQGPRRGLDSMKPETCKHPEKHIRDLPGGSICRKCDQPVAGPPEKRDEKQSKAVQSVSFPEFPSERETRMDWMGRIKK